MAKKKIKIVRTKLHGEIPDKFEDLAEVDAKETKEDGEDLSGSVKSVPKRARAWLGREGRKA